MAIICIKPQRLCFAADTVLTSCGKRPVGDTNWTASYWYGSLCCQNPGRWGTLWSSAYERELRFDYFSVPVYTLNQVESICYYGYNSGREPSRSCGLCWSTVDLYQSRQVDGDTANIASINDGTRTSHAAKICRNMLPLDEEKTRNGSALLVSRRVELSIYLLSRKLVENDDNTAKRHDSQAVYRVPRHRLANGMSRRRYQCYSTVKRSRE